MIFLSILAKTFALVLAADQPGPALACWVASLVADVMAIRRAAGRRALPLVARKLVLWNVAALVIGLAAAAVVSYAAMRWKGGIPVLSHLLSGLLHLLGVPAGVHEGHIYVTNMAGPLEFSASIDHLDLWIPGIFLALSMVWLLLALPTLGQVFSRLGSIAGILLTAVILRGGLWVLLVLGTSDFTGYETDELPFRPFVDPGVVMWLYLPFLLAGSVLLARLLPTPVLADRPPLNLPRMLKWLGAPALFLLCAAILWQPTGTMKSGKVVFSSHHTQWSPTNRPYDRDWYGADSGYNYACLKRLFGKFHPVVETNKALEAEDLADASILVVYVPDKAFTEKELEHIHNFVRTGGGLFLVGDHTNVFGSTSNLNDLCGRFGFQYRDDVLFDLDEDFHQLLEPPACGRSGSWHGMAFFKLRGPCSIRPTSLATRSVYQANHSKGIRAIYSVNNFYPPPHDYPQMQTGTFCVAASARYGRGRVAAWGDSTVFSNFEIFYPGKYEYLLNTLHWLNHEDGLLGGLARRVLPIVVLLGLALLLGRWRDPRVWLATLVLTVITFAAARGLGSWWEARQATFPEPQQPADWIFFAAHSDDPGHHLRDFIPGEPYDKSYDLRYEVFIQWVLRTGAFSGFELLGPDHVEGLHQHLRTSKDQRTALALIVRRPEDLDQLDELAAGAAANSEPMLLLFASSIPPKEAIIRLRKAGIVSDEEDLQKIIGAWPSGEVMLETGGRRLMVIAGGERFSDRAMGISEKVRPTPEQRAIFDQMFGVIDRFLGKDTPTDDGG